MSRNSLIAFIAGLLVACGGAVTAVAGPTLAEFQALQAQVVALTSRINTVESVAFGSSVYLASPTSGLSFKAAVPTDPAIGTHVGVDTGRLASANTMQLTSPMGFYFELPTDGAAAAAFLGDVAFEGAGCTGRMYLRQGTAISPYGARQGVVTRVHADVNDPTSYAMVAPGTTSTLVNALSRKTQASVCEDIVFSQLSFELVANDPDVSGVPSAPIGGEVVVGPGG